MERLPLKRIQLNLKNVQQKLLGVQLASCFAFIQLGCLGAYSKRHVYFIARPALLGSVYRAGPELALGQTGRVASSKRLKPDDFSMADSISLPSTPMKNLSCTVPSSSKRLEALGNRASRSWRR
jgi:hypothetical protein